MLNILNVYYYKNEYPPRATLSDHLYSFRRYTDHNCFYLNVAVRGVPSYLSGIDFDLVVFHTVLLSARWDRREFARVMREIAPLKEMGRVRVAMPQDEFLNTDLLCDFINEFGVDCVFSVAPESEWGKIYSAVDRRRVKFVNVLTGYLDDATLGRIERLAASAAAGQRPIDIGYRAWRGAAWLGRHGLLKAQIADVFEERGPARGLATDVSTRAEDTFFGDAWYEFLLRCKYTVGVEGGASVLDRDGSIRARTEAYAREHPRASFEEIEAACFPGADGELALFAISPRHLEACATRTCQVLVEGWYNGALRAGEHYIELKRDFSNLDEVLDLIGEDGQRERMTERAYRDVVASGRYTYRSFVESVVEQSVGDAAPAAAASAPAGPLYFLISRWMRAADRLSWITVMLHWYIVVPVKRQIRNKLVGAFSEQAISSLVRRVKGTPGA
ncbi:MAG: hypothetical protein LC800_21975 [Acidobacteria bacterium]|nr:hypothetical protein [Acidobacteriota bacterium]